jgi:hypothetical protein
MASLPSRLLFLICCIIFLGNLGFDSPRNNPPAEFDDAGDELFLIGEAVSTIACMMVMFVLLVGAVGSIFDARFTLDDFIRVACVDIGRVRQEVSCCPRYWRGDPSSNDGWLFSESISRIASNPR